MTAGHRREEREVVRCRRSGVSIGTTPNCPASAPTRRCPVRDPPACTPRCPCRHSRRRRPRRTPWPSVLDHLRLVLGGSRPSTPQARRQVHLVGPVREPVVVSHASVASRAGVPSSSDRPRRGTRCRRSGTPCRCTRGSSCPRPAASPDRCSGARFGSTTRCRTWSASRRCRSRPAVRVAWSPPDSDRPGVGRPRRDVGVVGVRDRRVGRADPGGIGLPGGVVGDRRDAGDRSQSGGASPRVAACRSPAPLAVNPVAGVSVHVRLLDPATDSFEELTALLHRAYAPLAAQGLRYSATHQSAEVTRQRAAQGECWVGELRTAGSATITVDPPGTPAGRGWYARPTWRSSARWRSTPERKGRASAGSSSRTPRPAPGRWGRRTRLRHVGARPRAPRALPPARLPLVGHCDWRPYVNYLSVFLSRTSSARAPAPCRRLGPRSRTTPGAIGADRVRGCSTRSGRGSPGGSSSRRRSGTRGRGLDRVPGRRRGARRGPRARRPPRRPLGRDRRGPRGGDRPPARGKGAGRRALSARSATSTSGSPPRSDHRDPRVLRAARVPGGARAPLPGRTRCRPGSAPPLRRLSADDPGDVAFVARALCRRIPQLRIGSRWRSRAGSSSSTRSSSTAASAPSTRPTTCWWPGGGGVGRDPRLAPSLPPLAEIAARLPADLRDRRAVLSGPARRAHRPRPGAPDDTVLMVRGDWPLEGPLVLPVHARC